MLIVKGTNPCGSDMATIQINAKKIGSQMTFPPTVTITDPSASSHEYATPNIVVTATVTRVNSKSEISVNFEGSSVPFTYDASAKKVTVPLTLNEGAQEIEIIASNANGTASDEAELIYKKEEVPCDKPKLELDSQFSGRVNTPTPDGYISGRGRTCYWTSGQNEWS